MQTFRYRQNPCTSYFFSFVCTV